MLYNFIFSLHYFDTSFDFVFEYGYHSLKLY